MGYSRYSSNVKKQSDGWKIMLFGLVMMGVGAIIGAVVGIFLFIRITGGTAAASAPIAAPTLAVDQTTVSTSVAINTLPAGTSNDMPSGVVTTAPTQISPQGVTIPTDVSLSPQLFRIVSEESEARFAVYETFPEGTAIGRTNQIAGDILVDPITPANSQIGTIRINLRTLQTDDADRDRSIRCCVLLTAQDAYEFSDFVPTAITGLPAQIQVGQTFRFQVTGNLTLRGVNRPVTFQVSVTPVNANELQGFATATVNRSEFGILNDAQNGFDYHGVEETITLEFDFVARAVPQ